MSDKTKERESTGAAQESGGAGEQGGKGAEEQENGPQPSALNPQPSTLSPQSSVLSPQSSVWEPEPIPAVEFYRAGEWVNINRAPYDQVSGVTYKRAAHIQRVALAPEPAPETPAPWPARGISVVRWLFSEQAGTEEHLLPGATFAFLHDLRLPPGAATGRRDHPGETHLLYGVAGAGMVYHHPHAGSPVLARPLRPGDAVLIRGTESYALANEGAEEVCLIVLGLYQSGD